MSSVYAVFYAFPTAPKPSVTYLGAWPTADDAIDFMNAGSCMGGHPYSALKLADIPIGTSVTYSDFAPMSITVFHLPIHRQSKRLYVRESLPPAVSTTKIVGATETVAITDCPVCGHHGVAADDEGHCSYVCATGT
jgi:hypothetical protein